MLRKLIKWLMLLLRTINKKDKLSIKGRVIICEWTKEQEKILINFIAQGKTVTQAVEAMLQAGLKPLDNFVVENLVTSSGKGLIIDMLRMIPGVTGLNYFAVGTGTNAPALTDTTLQTEGYRAAITGFVPDVGKLTVDFYLASSAANGLNLTEAAVFGDKATATANSGTLFSRMTHTVKAKDSSKAITYSWQYTFTS